MRCLELGFCCAVWTGPGQSLGEGEQAVRQSFKGSAGRAVCWGAGETELCVMVGRLEAEAEGVFRLQRTEPSFLQKSAQCSQ